MKIENLEKLRFVDSIRVIYPRFKETMDLIEEVHQTSLYSPNPASLLITGETGSGKTTLFKTYIEQHSKVSSKVVEGIQCSTKNILHISIPYPVRYTILTERLLTELGDPYPNKGTVAQKDKRLTTLIKQNQVQLVMLDEFQHFVDRDRRKVMLGVSDWFKSLMNETNIPFILFGLDSSNEVLDVNPQLSRRVNRKEITPFGYGSSGEKNEFQRLMFEIDKQVAKVFESTSDLADETCCERFMYATNGAMNSIMSLVRQGAKNALAREAERIELVDLARAYEKVTYVNRGKSLNPFAIHDPSALRQTV
ncbi:TniB family NTP-binding protein [Paenibacillus phytohabitans]|nr:TniB family NTP-binding protein [Paenibacillus phytohabitans]